jgi:hypothetical protein
MRFKLTAIGALALIPSLAVAQQTTSDTTMRDTTYTTSEGVLAEPSANFGLTTDQVKQLQKAINDNGCNAGDVTGVVDDATREGIQCIRDAKEIESTDINEVLKALGLPFTAGSTTGQNAISSDTTDSTMKSDTTFQTDSGILQRDSSVVRDTTTLPDTSMQRDTTMFPRDTSAMTRDSMPSMPTTPPTTTTLPDTSRTPFQH